MKPLWQRLPYPCNAWWEMCFGAPTREEHTCGHYRPGLRTDLAACKRFAQRPCIQDVRRAAANNASPELKTAACQWVVQHIPWNQGKRAIYRHEFRSCFDDEQELTTGEVVERLLADQSLHDSGLALLAEALVTQDVAVIEYSGGGPRDQAWQAEAERARTWCAARRTEIAQHPGTGSRTIAAIAATLQQRSAPKRLWEQYREVLQAAGSDMVDACFALAETVPSTELATAARLLLA